MSGTATRGEGEKVPKIMRTSSKYRPQPDAVSGEAPPRRFARARSDPMAPPPLYRKKSVDQKQIRFHQCYFNPISCFKK